MRFFTVLCVANMVSALPSASHLDGTGRPPIVHLDYATYKGDGSGGIKKFLGMRYAQPPLGDLRFRAPREPLRESVVIEATEVRHPFPSFYSRVSHATSMAVSAYRWPTPFKFQPITRKTACLSTSILPAMLARAQNCLLWYGFKEALSFVSVQNMQHQCWRLLRYAELFNPDYDGTGIIRASQDNVIVVTFNYRVGPYGFLASEHVRQDGDLNVGLLDQRAALKWVSKHISAFGGDPNKVTLMGTSVGGGSVLLNMVAYGGQQTSLFRAGIAGAVYMPPVYEVQDMEFQYQQLLNATECQSLACLRTLPTEKLQEANVARPFPGQTGAPLFPYAPVVDHKFLLDRPSKLAEEGRIVRKPLLTGTSFTEGTIFAPQANSTTDVRLFLQQQLPNLTNASTEKLNSQYKSSVVKYPGVQVDVAPLFYRAAEEYGDAAFTCPTFEFSAFLSSQESPVYTFLDHILDPVEVAAGYIVPHTWEVAAVWGPQYAKQWAALPQANSYDDGGVNAAMVDVVQAYWTSFIRTGNPNTYKLPSSPTWEQYRNGRQLLKLQTNSTVMQEIPKINRDRCTLWASLREETHF